MISFSRRVNIHYEKLDSNSPIRMLDNEKIARMVTIDFFSMADEEDPEAPSLS